VCGRRGVRPEGWPARDGGCCGYVCSEYILRSYDVEVPEFNLANSNKCRKNSAPNLIYRSSYTGMLQTIIFL